MGQRAALFHVEKGRHRQARGGCVGGRASTRPERRRPRAPPAPPAKTRRSLESMRLRRDQRACALRRTRSWRAGEGCEGWRRETLWVPGAVLLAVCERRRGSVGVGWGGWPQRTPTGPGEARRSAGRNPRTTSADSSGTSERRSRTCPSAAGGREEESKPSGRRQALMLAGWVSQTEGARLVGDVEDGPGVAPGDLDENVEPAGAGGRAEGRGRRGRRAAPGEARGKGVTEEWGRRVSGEKRAPDPLRLVRGAGLGPREHLSGRAGGGPGGL